MTAPAAPRRRWFSYSLRTLFVLLTAFGLFFGWLGVQLKWIHDREQAVEWLRDHSVERLGSCAIICNQNPAPWGVRILGGDSITSVRCTLTGVESAATDREIRRLFPEAEIQLFYE